MNDEVKDLMVLTGTMKAMLGGEYSMEESPPVSCLNCHHVVGEKDGDICLMQSDEGIKHKIPWSRWNPQEMPLDRWHDPGCPLTGGGVNDAARKVLFPDGVK